MGIPKVYSLQQRKVTFTIENFGINGKLFETSIHQQQQQQQQQQQ
jgi:hypothetical protein